MLDNVFRKSWEEEQVPETRKMDTEESRFQQVWELQRDLATISIKKIFNRLFSNQVKDSVDSQLPDRQVEFCRDRSYVD